MRKGSARGCCLACILQRATAEGFLVTRPERGPPGQIQLTRLPDQATKSNYSIERRLERVFHAACSFKKTAFSKFVANESLRQLQQGFMGVLEDGPETAGTADG